MSKLQDGSIISSYFNIGAPETGVDIKEQGGKTVVGQIDKVHFVDDPTNVSKKFIEYDVNVRNEQGGQTTFKNVRATGPLGGFNDNSETILEPNDVALKGKLDISNTFINKNGTLVYVSFRDNSLDKPYIEGAIDHPARTGATRAEGIHKKGEFRGLQWEINKLGEFILTYRGSRTANGTLEREDTGPTEIKIDQNGNFSFSNNESQSITVSRTDKTIIVTDGTNTITIDKTSNKITLAAGATLINIDGATGKIELTGSLVDVGEAASALAVLGPQMIAWLNTHAHDYISPAIPAAVVSTTPPTVPAPASTLSTTVKIKI